jgi:predicted aspartyl protease
MGEIRVKVKLQNSMDWQQCHEGRLPKSRVRSAVIDGVADTGAVEILLPQDLVDRLGLPIIGKVIVRLANDQKIELDKAGNLALTIAGRMMTLDCLVGPPGCEPLIGQLVMEGLDLIADPRKRTLTPRPESPYLPTLKMKPAQFRRPHLMSAGLA